MRQLLLTLFLSLVLPLMVGCNTTGTKPIADDPFYAPIVPAPTPQKVIATGSLFNTSNLDSLYADVKARNVGDIIEVILSEKTQAKKKANSGIKKDNSFSLSPLTGPGGQILHNGNTIELGLEQESEFTGEADADQSNSLTGSISVNVIRILPNGNLIVRGEKWITLNNGDEFIRLTGIIRSEDISADNQVKSNKVANARIQYSGTGSFADTQKMGWLARFFNSTLWPL